MKVLFDRFTLDIEARQLLDSGREVHLSPKAFDVLQMLIERRPAVVSKTELQERIWPGMFVGDANLNVLVAEIRRALQDDAATPRFIRTAHRVGYAFCGEVEENAPPPNQPRRSRAWLTWNDQTIPLAEGENVIGRDPRCSIWVDASGVSRRHARIVLAGDAALVEDLGSKNGTAVSFRPIEGPRRLHDGDVIQLGSTELKFRFWSEERAPETERLARRPGQRRKA
jgi:DNA-binding winged helix-turn-helix (wHTH) protein